MAGFERFEVTDEDYQEALDPSNRKRRKFTKEDALYGVWAENDSDEEEDKKGFGGKKPKDFTAPLNFVSSGVQPGSKIESGQYDAEVKEKPAKPKKPTKHKADSFAGLGDPSAKDIASWEKHTKGVGMKLLEKMGYKKGKGLGKEGAGIVTPIEAHVRKGKGAIGAYGSERINDPRQKNEPEGKQQRKAKITQKHQWRKSDAKAGSYQYKTVDELLQDRDKKDAGGFDTSDLSKVKVIDMTGKEVKVLPGYHAIRNRLDEEEEEAEERVFDVPELRHNLDELINMSEARILECTSKLDHEKNLVSSLQKELESLNESLENDGNNVSRLRKFMTLIDRLMAHQDSMTLQECAGFFEELFENHLEDYRYFEMDQLAAAVVGPILQRYLLDWNPLMNCSFGHREIQRWKRLLEPPQRSFEQSRNIVNSYHNVLWEVWYPFVQQAISGWSPTDYHDRDPVIDLFAIWEPVLPQWMNDSILEHLVLPRLITEVEQWEPTRTGSCHVWIHPWLPYLGSRLDILYGTIQSKLSAALTLWHPSDGSAKIMLQQWVDVWSRATWDQFLIKNILPKLQDTMERMIINPREQNLDAWNQTMEWKNLMPVLSFAALLERHFFPKWLFVLKEWLRHNPKMNEIRMWYSGWKQMIPEQMLQQPSIQEQMSAALHLISRAISGEPAPVFQPAPPPPPPPAAELPSVSLGFTNSAPTFKDVVERRANDMGIIFMPVPGKFVNGRQVFRFGSKFIYMDRSVIFVQRGLNWILSSLDELQM